MSSFPEVLRRFDDYMTVVQRAERTRAKYRYQLTLFWCHHLSRLGIDIGNVTEDDLVCYLSSLARNGNSRGDATRALRAFYVWGAGRIRADNPMVHLKTPKPKLAAAPTLPDPELRALLRAAFRREPRRGWAILLCFVTGARVGSLVNVRASDVYLDKARSYLAFRVAKGDRPYEVPLDRAGQIAARHLMALELPTLVGVGEERFRQWLRAADQEARIRHVNPHLLRHEFSNRVAREADPETWRQLMNHADLSQWTRYVAGEDERKRRAVASLI